MTGDRGIFVSTVYAFLDILLKMLISGFLMGSNRYSKTHSECSHISVLRQPLCLGHRHITLLTGIASFWVSTERQGNFRVHEKREKSFLLKSSWSLLKTWQEFQHNFQLLFTFLPSQLEMCTFLEMSSELDLQKKGQY